MANKFISSIKSGVKWFISIGFIASIMAAVSAPALFGMIMLTTATISAILFYATIGFILGFIKKMFSFKNETTNN